MKEQNAQISDEQKSIAIIGAACSPVKQEAREKIMALESVMAEYPQVDIPVTHRFCGNMYGREITIPKGTLLTGRIQKFDHFDIMLSGDMTVSTDSGEVKRITGTNIMEGKAGKKRAGYAHEDTHWITFHSAEVRDPEEMYEFLTCGSFDEFESFNVMLDRGDYRLMVDEMGMTEEQIQEQVQNEADMIEMPEGYEYLDVRESPIHGAGLYSHANHDAGEIICPARIGDKRSIAGRYTNHAFEPNAAMKVTDAGVDLVALKNIDQDEEITVNYRNVIEHRITEGDLCQV